MTLHLKQIKTQASYRGHHLRQKKMEIIAQILTYQWTGIITGILTALYLYFTWNFRYWKKQGIDGPKPWPIFGNYINPFKEPFDIQDQKNYQKYGRIYGIFEGRNPTLVVAEPELLKTIFVKDFHVFPDRRTFQVPQKDKLFPCFVSVMKGEEWRHLRNIITPAFTTGKMKQMLLMIEDCSKHLVEYVNPYAEDNKPVDFTKCLSAFSLEVIATCAFGTKINCLENQESDFVRHARKALSSPPKSILINTLFPVLAKILKLPGLIPEETTQYFTSIITDVINARKQQLNPRKDFLQKILEAKAESERLDGLTSDGQASHFKISQDHVVAQSLLFILAGFETTSTTLSFILYNIALREDIQDKMRKDVEDALSAHGNELNYDTLAEMKYLDMVISETLRMYPPAARVERVCQEDGYNLNGIVLNKKTVVIIPAPSIHYDEEFYPNPENFDPERFSPENRANINPYTYLPFGYGPRNCIGMRFALLEMKVILVYLLRHFTIKTGPETDIPFERRKKVRLLQPTAMNLKLEKRNVVKI